MNEKVKVIINKDKFRRFLLGHMLPLVLISALLVGVLLRWLTFDSWSTSFLVSTIYAMLLFTLMYLADFLSFWLKIKDWILRAAISSLAFAVSSMFFQTAVGNLWYYGFITGLAMLPLCLAGEFPYKDQYRKSPLAFLTIEK